MEDDETLRKIAYIIDALERRVTDIEASLVEMRASVSRIDAVEKVHEQSIANLSDRMSHESLSILDYIDDVKAMIDPVYNRAIPGFEKFNREVDAVLRNRRPRG